jgi:membrane glycosyltransferase
MAKEAMSGYDRSCWRQAQQRVLRYLNALDIDPVACLSIGREAMMRAMADRSVSPARRPPPVTATMRALREILGERASGHPRIKAASLFAPMPACAVCLPASDMAGDKRPAIPQDGQPPDFSPLPIAPKLKRGHMVSEATVQPRREPPHRWAAAARLRRVLLLTLITVTTIMASGYMAYVLPYQGRDALEITLLVFFSMLFAWISIGFWTSLMGFFMLLKKRDRWKLGPLPDPVAGTEDDRLPKTAILLPIYNEDTRRVFAGVAAIHASLEKTGRSDAFDFFVLSDSTDPDLWVAEESAWYETCLRLNAFGRIFYRHRSPNIKRKSGNIADFCRHWGKGYPYMIVLDADSLMAGGTLVRMVRLMERHPEIGILQTLPMLVGKSSLLARVQQFTHHLYGAMFAAGLNFWQLGDAQYWGHNAILRVAPFMQHCALARLSGRPPLGGEILSHDFVEAALMRRAGWDVWLAYDLDGSYEEPPSSLIEELMRDRRWCQGNLQHLRLLLTRGLLPAHRFLFVNGAMSYISALLWFCFLSLSTAEALSMVLSTPDYFPRPGSLFPDWPVWDPSWLIILLASTLIVLFLPKLLGLVLALSARGRPRGFGGAVKTIASFLVEVIISALLAPIRMLTHSKFVALTLLGGKIGWTPPSRKEEGTGWGTAFRFHGAGSLLALTWGTVVYWINPGFFWWLSPIVVPLLLSAPISVMMGSVSLGRRLRRWGFFLTLAEQRPPSELTALTAQLRQGRSAASDGFAGVVIDPRGLCLHVLVQRGRRHLSNAIFQKRRKLVAKALALGPAVLSSPEKKQLLNDTTSLWALHESVWELPDGEPAHRWGLL